MLASYACPYRLDSAPPLHQRDSFICHNHVALLEKTNHSALPLSQIHLKSRGEPFSKVPLTRSPEQRMRRTDLVLALGEAWVWVSVFM